MRRGSFVSNAALNGAAAAMWIHGLAELMAGLTRWLYRQATDRMGHAALLAMHATDRRTEGSEP